MSRVTLFAPRIMFAVLVMTMVLFGLGFAIGTAAGLHYGGRDKVCAEIESAKGFSIPICDYGFDPPPDAFVR